jgi:hypothetical protein
MMGGGGRSDDPRHRPESSSGAAPRRQRERRPEHRAVLARRSAFVRRFGGGVDHFHPHPELKDGEGHVLSPRALILLKDLHRGSARTTPAFGDLWRGEPVF